MTIDEDKAQIVEPETKREILKKPIFKQFFKKKSLGRPLFYSSLSIEEYRKRVEYVANQITAFAMVY